MKRPPKHVATSGPVQQTVMLPKGTVCTASVIEERGQYIVDVWISEDSTTPPDHLGRIIADAIKRTVPTV